MQAELATIRGNKLDKHLQARMDQSKPRSCCQIPGLAHTGILSIRNANRWTKLGRGFNRRQRKRIPKKAEKAVIKSPAIPTDFNDLFKLQFGLEAYNNLMNIRC